MMQTPQQMHRRAVTYGTPLDERNYVSGTCYYDPAHKNVFRFREGTAGGFKEGTVVVDLDGEAEPGSAYRSRTSKAQMRLLDPSEVRELVDAATAPPPTPQEAFAACVAAASHLPDGHRYTVGEHYFCTTYRNVFALTGTEGAYKVGTVVVDMDGDAEPGTEYRSSEPKRNLRLCDGAAVSEAQALLVPRARGGNIARRLFDEQEDELQQQRRAAGATERRARERAAAEAERRQAAAARAEHARQERRAAEQAQAAAEELARDQRAQERGERERRSQQERAHADAADAERRAAEAAERVVAEAERREAQEDELQQQRHAAGAAARRARERAAAEAARREVRAAEQARAEQARQERRAAELREQARRDTAEAQRLSTETGRRLASQQALREARAQQWAAAEDLKRAQRAAEAGRERPVRARLGGNARQGGAATVSAVCDPQKRGPGVLSQLASGVATAFRWLVVLLLLWCLVAALTGGAKDALLALGSGRLPALGTPASQRTQSTMHNLLAGLDAILT